MHVRLLTQFVRAKLVLNVQMQECKNYYWIIKIKSPIIEINYLYVAFFYFTILASLFCTCRPHKYCDYIMLKLF